MKELAGEAADLNLRPVQPGLDGDEPFGGAGWRETREVALTFERLQLEAKAVDGWWGRAQAGIGCGTQHQPHRPTVEDLCELMQPTEVDIAGGYSERMAAIDVTYQVRQRGRMASCIVTVVQELGTRHDHAISAKRSRTARR